MPLFCAKTVMFNRRANDLDEDKTTLGKGVRGEGGGGWG